ncbi:hypothetical protein Tco_1278731 [Tanacetum coccineum]
MIQNDTIHPWLALMPIVNDKISLTKEDPEAGEDETNKLTKSEVVVKSKDDKSSDDDTSKDSQDYLSKDSSEDLINFLSSRDLQWQFPKQRIRAEESKMDVLVLLERKTLKFLAQDMSFGCQAAGQLNGIFKHPLTQSHCIGFAIEV